ncbi:MAG: polysaccharide deacetylase family protein [Lachnospiraceae bacterium]|nr:polysaccharide deacetylase family protein [Lachnospiraceae bacterium]
MKNIAVYIRVLCILFCVTVALGGIFTVLADQKKKTVQQTAAAGKNTAVSDTEASETTKEIGDVVAEADSPATEVPQETEMVTGAEVPQGTEMVTEAEVQPALPYMGASGAAAVMKKGHRMSDGGKADVMTQMEHIGNPDQPAIALTFDDGPSDGPTDRILDVLEQYQAHATFFVMGYRVEKFADQINRAISLGCEIGNHSYNHPKLTAISESKVEKQIKRTKDQIKKAAGVTPCLVRPPYGAYNDTVLSLIKAPAILWSLDTRDWKTRNADKTVEAVLDNVQDGDIILMHDLYEPTAEAVERLVPELIDRGYQLVTVPELAALKGRKLKKGKTYIRLTAE